MLSSDTHRGLPLISLPSPMLPGGPPLQLPTSTWTRRVWQCGAHNACSQLRQLSLPPVPFPCTGGPTPAAAQALGNTTSGSVARTMPAHSSDSCSLTSAPQPLSTPAAAQAPGHPTSGSVAHTMPAQTSGSFALTWVSFPVQGGLPLQLPKHLDTPEELEPLKEALHRAHRRVQSSAQIREDLEGEVSRHHLHACRHGDLCRCLHTLRRCILGAWYHRGANREVMCRCATACLYK